MRDTSNWWIIAGCMLLMDAYFFTALRTVMWHSSKTLKLTITSVFWFFSILSVVFLLLYPHFYFLHNSKFLKYYVFSFLIGLFFAKLVGAAFFFIDDIRRAITWLIHKTTHDPMTASEKQINISRSVFLNWFGLAASGTLFSSLVYGISNKYDYQVKRIKLSFPNLPMAFKGMKILQISDIHSGSFDNKRAVLNGVHKIMNEKADLILFTGDLINDKASEMDNYIDVFSQLQAPMGVYSILGNHDYGDYYYGMNPTGELLMQKENNFKRLLEVHGQLGWRLMLNEHVVLTKNGESIALIGIENWGALSSFPKYGKLSQAYAGTEPYSFKILMSHDPSHWDAEIRPKFPDIDLTLSGHTHGMQFGVETPRFKWSPIQWIYKEWAGLYEAGKQKLYVNRGFGFLGYPGRVGILPEITVIELV